MNYEPNTTHWKRGDIVIHDADAKKPNMLMRVIGYSRDGLVRTQYIDRMKHRRFIYKNDTANLHDPKRFNIPLPERYEQL